MDTGDRARALRAEGVSFDSIAQQLGIGLQWAYKLAGDVLGDDAKSCRNTLVRKTAPRETAKTVIKWHSLNGGCSSLSGLIPISMPRITALHGALA